ncbi:MAG TPA: 4-alpha-glucanotransferase, partial [Burkholderiaceae bacterium]|nr:4-alpha-glucanotransferase [Burkholderiaceae bacterium]
PAVQLYALRSERNWGMGDFGDLAVLVETFAERGAGIVGLNPLHALFPHNPAHASPYSPSSRSQLNVLYLDVEAIEDFRECEPEQRRVREAAFQQRLARLRAAEQVDYVGVAAAKFEVLEALYAHFRERHLHTASARGRAFRAFQAERGAALRWHASFEALQARFHGADSAVWGWPLWPPEYRDAHAPAVQRFQAEHEERIEYFEYLQWQAELQLGAIARRCRERGLAVGLYLDLAVSVDRAGSDAWAHHALYARGATVGAPPDEFNPNGQDWGLPPLRPDRLVDDRCTVFIDTLRACMRHAGALRIDHVMGLMRLYWVPGGHSAREGAYVRYPLAELMAIVTLESERNRCMVIGEDLGTVADEMRAALARNELLSYRLLYFERGDDGAFKPPQAYPREALVAVSTHDLPTLAGWWSGHDLQVRARLGLYANPDQLAQQQAARALDRERLLQALQNAGLLGEGAQDLESPLTQELAEAVHTYVAMAAARVMVMQLEDALGVLDQPNLPGTVDEHPNWRRKLPLALPALAADARVQALSSRLAHLRPHAPLRVPAQPRAEAIVPRATYRLQFHAGFGFDEALQVLPYLQRLGVSHVYCSPLTRARPGSLHGYDVVAHDEINPELGGRAGFERFCIAARALGLGLLLDLVPNHMGIGSDNAWWMDVLENGPASLYARYFDIDWQPMDRALEGKVLLPVLGEHFGRVLEDGRLQLRVDAARGVIELHCEEQRFPLDPRSLAPLLHRAAQRSGPGLSAALQSLAEGFERLPARDVEVLQARLQRAHDKEVLRSKLAALLHADDAARGALQAELEAQDADALEALHEAQAYRLAYWRVASDEINYR